LFANASSQQSVLDAISNPAERSLTWQEYRPIFLTRERIDAGLDFFDEHRALLSQAQERFGVPAEVITAIIGVETFYGRITGSYKVLEALATLAFDYPPRAEFFLSELSEFIVLAAKEGWDTPNVKGSYAGAMGFPQFISSSYRAYAIDFDNDGKRDLFANPADIIGSVAHYLAKHGWVAEAPIAERWQVDDMYTDAVRWLVSDSLKPDVNVSTVRALGFDSGMLDAGTQADRLLSVVALNGSQDEELWIAYQNFYAITRYNHSHLYAMAVFQLADAIRNAS
jgi:membrane-bound lytic murein transglycosylase B